MIAAVICINIRKNMGFYDKISKYIDKIICMLELDWMLKLTLGVYLYKDEQIK